MSVSSTSQNNDFLLSGFAIEPEREQVFRFKDFIHGLLSDLNRGDVKPRGLLVDKTSKAHPVRVIVLDEREIQNSDVAELAIRKIHSILKKHLGFLIDQRAKTLDETFRNAFIELIIKCQRYASDLNLQKVSKDLQKLTKKIDQFVQFIEDKEEFFLYRYVGENQALLAFGLSYKSPESIQGSSNFWRRCTKVAYVKFSQMWGEKKGRIPEKQSLHELFKRVSFPVTRVDSAEKGGLFPPQAGLCLKKSVWRFVRLQAYRLELKGAEALSCVTQDEFLQILDFLLSPKKHPISWDSINTLWNIAQSLGMNQVEWDCLKWLKNEMKQYSQRSQDVQRMIFDQVVNWHKAVGCKYPTEYEDFFDEVVHSTKSLEEFNRVLSCLIEKRIQLTRLAFSSTSSLSTSHYKKLSAMTVLRKLSIGDTSIDDEGIKTLASLKLTELDLDDGRCLTEDGLQYLARMTTLERASIGRLSPYLSDTGLKFLSRLPLSCIDLTRCDLVTNDGLRALKGGITELSFGRSAYLTPAVLANLVSLPLEKLTLFRISGLVTEDLLALNSFSNLKSLELIAAKHREESEPTPGQITDLVIPLLAVACPKLTHLKLENVPLTNAGMNLFHSLMSLEELTLSQLSVSLVGSVTRLSKLTSLGLLHCDLITGRSLRPLKGMYSLRSLDLMSKQIGDLSLPDILNITQLTSLNLAGCAFSSPQALKDCLPVATKLKRLAVSTQFFSLAHGIAAGILAHGDVPAPEYALENSDLNDKKLWELALSIKHRIPLDYFKILLKKDPTEWMPKIIGELGKRVDNKHNFTPEDFTKALELMSWAIDKNSLELTKCVWNVFFKPDKFGYSSRRDGIKEHPLDTVLFYSVYGDSRFDQEALPPPLEIIDFLVKKQVAKGLKAGCKNFIANALAEYKNLILPVTLAEIDYLEPTTECYYFYLRVSQILCRLLIVKLFNGNINALLDKLCVKLIQYCQKRESSSSSSDGSDEEVWSASLSSEEDSSFRLDSFIAQANALVALIVFAQKQDLEKFERVCSLSFINYLSSETDFMKQEHVDSVMAILKKQNLSTINIDTNILNFGLHGMNMDMSTFWFDTLESQESLEIIRK